MIKHSERSLVPLYIGNSDEEKPTDDTVVDGAEFYERDTQKKYTFSKDDGEWKEGSYA